MQKARVVAEVGCNHMGSMKTAKEMIKIAAGCGVHAVKFQKRNVELYDKVPHPVPANSYGPTYYDHRVALEFNLKQHAELKECCEDHGVVYSCSVWDRESAAGIMSLYPAMIKIPSAVNNNLPMLFDLVSDFPGQLHISMGMTTQQEEEAIMNLFSDVGGVVFYCCTSAYPIKPEEAYLLEILHKRMARVQGDQWVGFSGHHTGIVLDPVAYSMGAIWIERHFTLDKTLKGTDHSASLEPDELDNLVLALADVHKALEVKPDFVAPVEIPQRKKLKHSKGDIDKL